MNRALITNPTVLVYPDANLSGNDRTIVAAVTQNDIGIIGEENVQALRNTEGIQTFIAGYTQFSVQWARNHNDAHTSMLVYWGTLILLIVAILASGWALSKCFGQVYHQYLRVTQILGIVPRHFLAMILCIEAITAILLCWYIWHLGGLYRTWTSFHGGIPADPATLAQFYVHPAVWVLCIFILTLTSPALFHHRKILQLQRVPQLGKQPHKEEL